ncbi:MAG: flagellar protein FlbB [Leptospiraceae bacterium]|nr:flagellar protein FlbB [Leptospiraceae bacterium]MCP5497752.1 flagellar protein FlbB [Leptospiraceae bacterium]
MTFTDRTRVIYLIILILFLLVIGFFVLDHYQLIEADEIFPILAKKPATVEWDKESPTEVEKLEFQKAKERLLEDINEIEKAKRQLAMEKEKIKNENEMLDQLKQGIDLKEKELKEKELEEKNRQARIKVMAEKISGMPPNKAVEMLQNWPDEDIIQVFIQMDKNAEAEGTQTITTYLLTLFPPERRASITNKWMDSEVDDSSDLL